MFTLKQKVEDFLSQKTIVVAGVSSRSKDETANHIYRKLRSSGYQVFPVNPNAEKVEGDICYPTLKDIPEKVDAVLIVTRPEVTEQIVRECAKVGISRVWMHRSFGTGSVYPEAVRFCQENNISVIAGACPMMYCKPVDFGHKCMRWVLRVTGGLPK